MLEKVFELQQKDFALLNAQRVLEEMRQRTKRVEATQRFERGAFEEAMESLKDDLSRAQVAQEEAEARE